MTKKRKTFSSQEKVSILRQHLLEKVPISDLCDQHGLHPTLFYRWQKTFFEKGAAAFDRNGDAVTRQLQSKVAALEAKLTTKDEVIAEIMESHVQLKKKLGQT